MDFDKLCTFDFFARVSGRYGYCDDFQEMVEKEFRRLKGVTYLDHAGATLYPECAVQSYSRDLSTSVYGNPHSRSPSSRLTHDTVERVRYRILQHFDADPDEYSVVFTSGCTAALKLVAESFPWVAGSVFAYLTDNHTSVVGMRALARRPGVTTLPVAPEDVEGRNNAAEEGKGASRNNITAEEGDARCPTPHLFCFPAQSNFSGRKYPLSYVSGVRARGLYPASAFRGKWFVLVDPASHVSSSPLSLKRCRADFIPVSFYKMFGFPTGLGALLVRAEAAAALAKRSYFGGGTAAAYLSGEDYYVPAESTSDRFEDGTVSFLDVIALNHSFDALYKLTGGMQWVQQHTFSLARFTYMVLSNLRHGTGLPAAQIYTEGQFDCPSTQGPIINFNLLDAHGDFIGYSQVDRMAALYNIHVRTGCFCNTGACQAFLGISDRQVKSNLQAGHVCGDDVDLVLGRPTGSVRVSFGYMSTFQDCQSFLRFVVECFVEGPVTVDRERVDALANAPSPWDTTGLQPIARQNGKETEEVDEQRCRGGSERSFGHAEVKIHKEEGCSLTNIYIYPIKSCGAFEVQQWPLGRQGLLFDRSFMVVNANGVCLSQKREPRLCLIKPEILLSSNQLLLHATEMESISVPLETKSQSKVCQSKVCGDRVETLDCGDAAAEWLERFLRQKCRLIRLSPDFTRDAKKTKRRESSRGDASPVSSPSCPAPSPLSLVNEAQYLMVNRASVEHIHRLIHDREEVNADERLVLDVENVISRFRANLVLSGAEAFHEDNWSQLIIAGTRFVVSGQCSRCHMIGTDQETGAKTKEPLMTLSAFRNQGKVTFGVYLSHQLPLDSDLTTLLQVGSSVQTLRS
ncbi:molybdenum cofactor sulfurase [Eucyclogobius newberryi]|uniref:molybdenum cofactor sulfurase n=1 Tax=Eucyclogobius newberryi TaxID=166745 RepID=UPI003B5C4B20